MDDMRGRGGAVSTCRVPPRNCIIVVVKERVGAVGSYREPPESDSYEGRGRGCHELLCPARRRQKREEQGEVLRAVLGCQMRRVKRLSQSAGVCQRCLGLRGGGTENCL